MNYRLTHEDIEGDPEYMIGAFPIASGSEWYPDENYKLVEYFPERLVWRVIGVAKAYDLHFPSQLSNDGYSRSVLRNAQVESLETQLTFLAELLNDELVENVIRKIQGLCTEVLRSSGKLELAFEGP